MADKRQSKDVDQTVTDTANVVAQTPFQRMLRMMESEATAEVEENKFSGDDLNAILTAETEDALWDADERGPLNGQHLAACELALVDVSVKFSRGESDIVSPFQVADGRGGTRKMYLLVTAYRLSDAGEKSHLRLPAIGELFEFNTSARFLVAKIWSFYTKGYIDPDAGKVLECVIRETDLGGGQGVLKLRPMPRRAVRVDTDYGQSNEDVYAAAVDDE
jgi:hypothetical protein